MRQRAADVHIIIPTSNSLNGGRAIAGTCFLRHISSCECDATTHADRVYAAGRAFGKNGFYTHVVEWFTLLNSVCSTTSIRGHSCGASYVECGANTIRLPEMQEMLFDSSTCLSAYAHFIYIYIFFLCLAEIETT